MQPSQFEQFKKIHMDRRGFTITRAFLTDAKGITQGRITHTKSGQQYQLTIYGAGEKALYEFLIINGPLAGKKCIFKKEELEHGIPALIQNQARVLQLKDKGRMLTQALTVLLDEPDKKTALFAGLAVAEQNLAQQQIQTFALEEAVPLTGSRSKIAHITRKIFPKGEMTLKRKVLIPEITDTKQWTKQTIEKIKGAELTFKTPEKKETKKQEPAAPASQKQIPLFNLASGKSVMPEPQKKKNTLRWLAIAGIGGSAAASIGGSGLFTLLFGS